jgi:hypothetical protein
MRRCENGQPNLRARSRTDPWLRFNAAATRTTDAPWVTSAFNRSSSSGDHGLDISGISVTKDHRTNRKDGRADPNQDGGPLLRNDWRRFHDSHNRNVINRFPDTRCHCLILVSEERPGGAVSTRRA